MNMLKPAVTFIKWCRKYTFLIAAIYFLLTFFAIMLGYFHPTERDISEVAFLAAAWAAWASHLGDRNR